MKAIVIKVCNKKESKHGGDYILSIFKNIDENSNGEEYPFYCYLENENSSRFLKYLKPQAIFENIQVITWKNKKVISGNSNFIFIGIRHEK